MDIDHIQGLSTSDSKTRMQAIRKSAQLGDSRAVPQLCSLLNEQGDQSVLGAVVKALGKIGDGSAIPALIANFDKLEQGTLVTTLSQLGVFDSVLYPGGGSGGAKLRRQIRRALGLADRSALKQLLVEGELSEDAIREVIPNVM